MVRNALEGETCFRCGICCMKYQVRLTTTEAGVLARNLGLSLPEFIDNYTDPRWPGNDTYLLKHENGACVFLQSEGNQIITSCRIHNFRPQDCRNWIAGWDKPECRKGRLLVLSKVKGLANPRL